MPWVHHRSKSTLTNHTQLGLPIKLLIAIQVRPLWHPAFLCSQMIQKRQLYAGFYISCLSAVNSTVNRSSTLKSRYRLCLVPYLPLHGDLALTRASIPLCPFLLFKALSSHTHLYLHSLPTLSFLSLSALSHFIHQFPQSRVGEYLPLIFSSGVIYGLGIHFEEEPNILSVSLQLVNPD